MDIVLRKAMRFGTIRSPFYVGFRKRAKKKRKNGRLVPIACLDVYTVDFDFGFGGGE